MPAWSDASRNVGHASVAAFAGTIPGSTLLLPAGNVTLAPRTVLPVNRSRMVAPAALKMLCPEMNSGNGGVTTVPG